MHSGGQRRTWCVYEGLWQGKLELADMIERRKLDILCVFKRPDGKKGAKLMDLEQVQTFFSIIVWMRRGMEEE